MKFSSGLTDFTTSLLNLSQSKPGSFSVLGVNSPQSGSLIAPQSWFEDLKQNFVTSSTPPPSQGINANMTGRPDTTIPTDAVALWKQVANMSTGRI
jgi:hypothetical protein